MSKKFFYSVHFAHEKVQEYLGDVLEDIFEKELWVKECSYKFINCEQWNGSSWHGITLSCDEWQKKLTKENGREQWCYRHISNSKYNENI